MALFGFGYKRKIEQLKQLLDAQNYEAAALLADDIPVQKVKTAYELNLIGKAYKCNEDFLHAKNVFGRSYEMRCSRTVLLDIMDCCLEIKDLDSAEKYFDEYHRVAPDDRVTQYVYRYRIEKKKKRERHLLISILEELKALEYIEEYAYELAKQYHKAGMKQECMNECNDIILWFGFGPTVERAKALLAYYRGEISLEEIKSAGARYQEELNQRWQEEKQKQAEITETEETAMVHKATDIINSAKLIPCTGCEYCIVNCPQNIAIPKYFSLYNRDISEAKLKKWTVEAAYYERLATTFGKASDCIECGQCENMCPQHLPIIEHLKEVAKNFEK